MADDILSNDVQVEVPRASGVEGGLDELMLADFRRLSEPARKTIWRFIAEEIEQQDRPDPVTEEVKKPPKSVADTFVVANVIKGGSFAATASHVSGFSNSSRFLGR